MLLVVGQATSLADHFLHQDKDYEAIFSFGLLTETFDPVGPVVDQRTADEASTFVAAMAKELAAEVASWTTLSEQLPPLYSALKIGGQRMSDRVRRGEEVERRPRPIKVSSSELLELNPAAATLKVRLHVSSGTYVRSFATRLAEHFDFPVHVSGLRRLRVGGFLVEDPRVWLPPAKPPADPSPAVGVELLPTVLPLTDALEFPALEAPSEVAVSLLRNGRQPNLAQAAPPGDFLIVDHAGDVVAWARGGDNGSYALQRVFGA